MQKTLATLSVTVFTAVALTSPLWADMTMTGDLHIEGPMLRATAPNAPVAAGYVTIANTGDADDRLLSAAISAEVAGMVELHEMTMSDGVMSMSEVDGGIVIPAGETVNLMPGGLHLMLMGMNVPLTEGESHPVTLTFESAGEVTMDFSVLSLGDIRAALGDEGHGDHGGHGEMKHGEGAHSGHGN